MSVADFAGNLNRRNKAALCATLICVGLIVLLGGGVRIAVSIGILGLAFSWALGSGSRLVHWTLVVFGLLLLVPAVGDVLLGTRTKLIEIQKQFVENKRWDVQSDERQIKDATVALGSTQSPIERRQSLDLLDVYQKALDDSRGELYKAGAELESQQREGILRFIVRTDWQSTLGGLLLLGAGVGLIVGVKAHGPSQPTPEKSDYR